MPPQDLVWYVAYGSNLWSERFHLYIEGGSNPDVQAGRTFTGCRDTTPPRTWQRVELPGEVYFAKRSSAWQNGGVAFLHTEADATFVGRAWQVTRQQYFDVFDQENGREIAGLHDHRLDLNFITDGW